MLSLVALGHSGISCSGVDQIIPVFPFILEEDICCCMPRMKRTGWRFTPFAINIASGRRMRRGRFTPSICSGELGTQPSRFKMVWRSATRRYQLIYIIAFAYMCMHLTYCCLSCILFANVCTFERHWGWHILEVVVLNTSRVYATNPCLDSGCCLNSALISCLAFVQL